MDYANGKIYKLVSNVIPDIYIGSTCTELKKRKHCHKIHYEMWKKGLHRYITSFKLFEAGDVEIVLIESCPCASKDELFARERFWIESTVCVNKNIPGRTRVEHYEQNRDKILERAKELYEQNKDKILEYQKQYREQNRDKISEQNKEWREQNIDKISEQNKEYREQNKEKMAEYMGEYRERNKEAISLKAKEKVICEICKSEVRKGGLPRHQKSKKCLSNS